MALNINDLDPKDVEILAQADEQKPLSIDDIDQSQIEVIGKPDVSTTASIIRGAMQGITFNHMDELSAKAESLVTSKSYDQALTEYRQLYKDSEDANPAAFKTAEVAGSFVGFGKAGKALESVKAVKALSPAVKAITSGAVLGSIDAVGESEEDAFAGQFSDALEGALGGAVFGAAGEVVGKGISKLGSKFIKSSTDAAEKALGAYNGSQKRALSKILEKRGINAQGFLDDLSKIKGVDDKPLLSGIKNQAQVLDDVSEKIYSLSDDFSSFFNNLKDAEGKEIKIASDTFLEPVINDLSERFAKDPSLFSDIKSFKRIQSALVSKMKTSKEMSFKEISVWKDNLMRNFDPDKNWFKLDEVQKETIKSIKNNMMSYAKTLASPESYAKFENINKEFGILSDASKIMKKSVEMDSQGVLGKIAKQLAFHSPVIGALAGSASGTPEGALVGALVGGSFKAASKNPKFNSVMSKQLLKVGSFLESSPESGKWLQALSLTAADSMDSFKGTINTIERHMDGFITSQEEEQMHRQQIKSSQFSVRDQMRMSNELNNGRIPNYQPQSQPFIRPMNKKQR